MKSAAWYGVTLRGAITHCTNWRAPLAPWYDPTEPDTHSARSRTNRRSRGSRWPAGMVRPTVPLDEGRHVGVPPLGRVHKVEREVIGAVAEADHEGRPARLQLAGGELVAPRGAHVVPGRRVRRRRRTGHTVMFTPHWRKSAEGDGRGREPDDVAGSNAAKARAGRRGSTVIMGGRGYVDPSTKAFLFSARSCEPKWYTSNSICLHQTFDTQGCPHTHNPFPSCGGVPHLSPARTSAGRAPCRRRAAGGRRPPRRRPGCPGRPGRPGR